MGLLSIFRKRPEPAPLPAPEPEPKPKRARYYPSRALKRAMEDMFGASGIDRLNASWPAQPLSADQIIRRHQRVLVARSRQQATQNDYGKAFLRLCRQNIVGPHGIQLQAQVLRGGKLDTAVNDAIEDAWWEWGRRENCDVTGRKSFVSMQLAAVQGAAKDGEFMFRKIYGPDAGPWGFALQLLDPQRCPVDYDVDRYTATTFIRHGIEFNRYGRPLAYHFTTTDEVEADYSYGGRAFVRIPADEIIHGFKDELGGQKRGLPWMATALFRLRNLGAYEDAAIVNARVGAAKMGFIEWEEGEGPELEDDEELPEIDAEAGVFEYLPSGARLKEWDPKYPDAEFAPFTKHMLRSIAAGLGVAYNELANDLEDVNYSSIRQGTLDFRERWKEDQEWLIEQLLQPVFDAWLPVALLSNRIKVRGKPLRPERINEYSRVEWQPRRWSWIDPNADSRAAVLAKNNLLTSPGQIIREQGRDPSQVYSEIAQDIEQMRAAGIPEEYIKLAMGQKLNPNERDDEKQAA